MTRAFLLGVGALSLALSGCGAAQMMGTAIGFNRDLKVTNHSKLKVCSIELVNSKDLLNSGPQVFKDPKDGQVEAGETKVLKILWPKDQDREIVAKGCKGERLASQNGDPGDSPLAMDIP
jgi:hypothetical protein